MKLIKLTDEHYVIVDENAEIKEGDWYLGLHNKVIKATDGKHYAAYVANAVRLSGKPVYKITHSTDIDINELYYISLQEVKELLGEVDVYSKKFEYLKKINEGIKHKSQDERIWIYGASDLGFTAGYNQAIEDNKEKKYTEEDVIAIVEKSRATGLTAEYIIQSLQQPTQWDVEFDSQYKLKLI